MDVTLIMTGCLLLISFPYSPFPASCLFMGIVYAKSYHLSWKKEEMLEFWYISPKSVSVLLLCTCILPMGFASFRRTVLCEPGTLVCMSFGAVAMG